MVKRNKPFLEPTTQAFVDVLEAQGGKPLYTLSYEDARKVLEDAQTINVRKLPADIEDTVFPDGPTGEVSVRIYRPVNTKALLPVVMYFPRRRLGAWQPEHARQIAPRPGER